MTSLTHLLSLSQTAGKINCENFVNNITSETPDFFSQFKARYGAPVTEEEIENFLQNINQTIGLSLTNEKVTYLI